MKKRLGYQSWASRRFWEISRRGCRITRCWGRVGTTGRKSIKDFDTIEKAKIFAERAIAQKLKNGYIDSEFDRAYVEPNVDTENRRKKFDLQKELDEGARRKKLPSDFETAFHKWLTLEKGLPLDILHRVPDISLSIAGINRLFARACWAWGPIGKCVRGEDIDRVGEYFLGPPYTCRGYEWPLFAGDRLGILLAQIDLDRASDICGVKIGNGLLQLFIVPDWDELNPATVDKLSGQSPGYVMRRIPRSFVSRKALTPVPQRALEQMSKFEEFEDLNPLGECLQISGFKNQHFTIPVELPYFIDGLFREVIEELNDCQRPTFEHACNELIETVQRLTEKYPCGLHLFGAFNERWRDYSPRVPLFCVCDSLRGAEIEAGDRNLSGRLEYGFCVYGDGDGHIAMVQDKNYEIDFYFDGRR